MLTLTDSSVLMCVIRASVFLLLQRVLLCERVAVYSSGDDIWVISFFANTLLGAFLNKPRGAHMQECL